MDFYNTFIWLLGKGMLNQEGIEFLEDNTDYFSTHHKRIKLIFHTFLTGKINLLLATETIPLGIDDFSVVYVNEQKAKLEALEDVFSFRSPYYNYQNKRNETESTHNINQKVYYLNIKEEEEHPLLTLLPLLKFRQKGYAVMLGAANTKLDTDDYGVDGAAYHSRSVAFIQDQLGIGGFFLNELGLIRNFPEEFHQTNTSIKEKHLAIENEIVLFEAERGEKEVLDKSHGVRQIEAKLEAGIANKGFVAYDEFSKGLISKEDIDRRLKNNTLCNKIGLLNLGAKAMSEPTEQVPLSDFRVLEYMEYWLKAYLLCNFYLNELIEIAGTPKGNIEEVKKILFTLTVEEIVCKLKSKL